MHGQGQKTEQKRTTKNSVEFHIDYADNQDLISSEQESKQANQATQLYAYTHTLITAKAVRANI